MYINIFKKIVLLLTLLLSACASPKNPPSTVSQVDLKKYMGRWYEIASFPNSFQRGCQCTTADYQLTDNKVKILNRCYKGKKYKPSSAHGIAWAVPGSNNSKFKVQFFWPFRGDYWILYLSPGYEQVIVGTPNRKYLWILARKRHISDSIYNNLKSIAEQKGFPVNQLVKTKQTCEEPSI